MTLGLALPWREASLERYKMRHTHFGDLQGDFEGDGWTFFKRGWWLWLLTPVAIVIFPAAPFLYAEFKAREWRWWLDGIRIGATLPVSEMFKRILGIDTLLFSFSLRSKLADSALTRRPLMPRRR